MTIERVTYPDLLSGWNPDEHPLYLELFGETSPTINTAYAEVLAAKSAEDADPTLVKSAPIYEYWWTIGHPGGVPLDFPGVRNVFGHIHRHDMWTDLPEHDAAWVLMSFPLGHGWRIKELTATLKYLAPAHDQRTIGEESTKVWNDIAPLLTAAGGIAADMPGAAPADPALHTAGAILGTLGKLSLNSVPAGEKFPWSATKMTTPGPTQQPTQTILWQLPAKVFTDLGGRITGGISVSFIPDQIQSAGEVAKAPSAPSSGKIGCECIIRSKQSPLRAPADQGQIELSVFPQLAPNRATAVAVGP